MIVSLIYSQILLGQSKLSHIFVTLLPKFRNSKVSIFNFLSFRTTFLNREMRKKIAILVQKPTIGIMEALLSVRMKFEPRHEISNNVAFL